MTHADAALTMDVRSSFRPAGSAFVWTRFGTEAGETIQSILARKEQERVANGGVFLWGIGNSVGRAVSLLHRECTPMLVFSPIAGKPRGVDVAPAGTVWWMDAEDWLGFPAALPPHSVVTSREGRSAHYALVCRSWAPLTMDGEETFHIDALTNFESGNAVGASQTTAVVRCGDTRTGRAYKAALVVELAAPFFVRLTSPKQNNQLLPQEGR